MCVYVYVHTCIYLLFGTGVHESLRATGICASSQSQAERSTRTPNIDWGPGMEQNKKLIQGAGNSDLQMPGSATFARM